MEEKNQTKKLLKKMNQFVVIGLGRFGKTVASSLASLGNEVLAIDTNAEAVKQLENKVSSAVVADATATGVLQSLGVQNFDCVIICIGANLQANILATLMCKDLGVPYVVAKAQNEQNKKILERIGADLVVFPESYMGVKVAQMLANPSINEIMSLTSDYKIVEMALPAEWEDKTIIDSNIRKKYDLSIIFIKRNDEVLSPNADTILRKGDVLIVSGNVNKLNQINTKSNEVLDVVSFLDNFSNLN